MNIIIMLSIVEEMLNVSILQQIQNIFPEISRKYTVFVAMAHGVARLELILTTLSTCFASVSVSDYGTL